MEPATVIGLVTALVETYADGLEDYTTWKNKRSASNRYEGRGGTGSFCALTTSLGVSGSQIKETYDNALFMIGSEFSTGDCELPFQINSSIYIYHPGVAFLY
jgi:hypothetical protein